MGALEGLFALVIIMGLLRALGEGISNLYDCFTLTKEERREKRQIAGLVYEMRMRQGGSYPGSTSDE